METFSSKSGKPAQKRSEILQTCYHKKDFKWIGLVTIGPDNFWTTPSSDKEEVESDLRSLEKQLNYELIETVEMEGVYPERATIIEEKYQASGRTNSLYTGLNLNNGKVLNDITK